MVTPQEKFKECYNIFLNETIENGNPISCKIHEVFGGNTGNHHNCLGCNFADSSNLILRFLSKYNELDDIQQDFTVYILLLYLLVERIEIILDIVQLPLAYREKHFKVFQQIRKWANFIKHPKSFILTHHPIFDFTNSGIAHDISFKQIINEQFVDRYYKGHTDQSEQKKINKELYNLLRNQKDVLVSYPDIAKLTEKICYSYKKFIELVIKNEVYIEILNDESTISRFFEN